MFRLPPFVVAGALTLLAPVTAHGWNNVGHMTIAKRAYEQLTTRQKLKIAEILSKHPHYAIYLRSNRPAGVTEDEWVFLRASIWPDWVRPNKRRETRGPEITKYHIGPDHYTDKPFVVPAAQTLFAGRDIQPDPQHNILVALERRMAELKADSVSTQEKAVALCWLLHLVGDVQQPLHCTSLFSALYAYKDQNGRYTGDQGGNLFYVKIDGQPWRLHAYWDGLPGAAPGGYEDTAQNMINVYELVQQNVGTLRAAEYQRERLAELMKAKEFAGWVDEGAQLARTNVYLDGALKGTRSDGGAAPDDVPEAPADYARKASALARRRLALGSYRLLDKLRAAVPSP